MKIAIATLSAFLITIQIACNQTSDNTANNFSNIEKVLMSDTQFIAYSEKVVTMQKYLNTDYFGLKKVDTAFLNKNRKYYLNKFNFLLDSLGVKHADEYIKLRTEIGQYLNQLKNKYPEMKKINPQKLFNMSVSVTNK